MARFDTPQETTLSPLERQLLDHFQQEIPLVPRPYAAMAEKLGVSEKEVMERLVDLKQRRAISRVGAVFQPNRVGASSLAAMAVPPEEMERVAAFVNKQPEINHNYERENQLNLWFVIVASDRARVEEVAKGIENETGLPVLLMPMLEDFHINLGFPLKWHV